MGWVLFFDGDCGFCSKSVQRVARFDSRGRVAFAALQGKLAREMDFTQYASKVGGSMVLLREADGKILLRSDAAIELAHDDEMEAIGLELLHQIAVDPGAEGACADARGEGRHVGDGCGDVALLNVKRLEHRSVPWWTVAGSAFGPG